MQSTVVITVSLSERNRKGESYVMLSQEEVEALRKAVNFGFGELDESDEENLK